MSFHPIGKEKERGSGRGKGSGGMGEGKERGFLTRMEKRTMNLNDLATVKQSVGL